MPRVTARRPPSRRQSVDEALVAHVHATLRPSRDALTAMLERMAALRTELLEPALAAWAAGWPIDAQALVFT